MAVHFDDDDYKLLICWLPIYIHNKFHATSGVMIEWRVKHEYFV